MGIKRAEETNTDICSDVFLQDCVGFKDIYQIHALYLINISLQYYIYTYALPVKGFDAVGEKLQRQ